MEQEPKKKVLGRGLSALISTPLSVPEKLEESPVQVLADKNALQETYRMIPIKDIIPNRDQPRQIMEEQALAELAESIKAQGILQPVIVTRKNHEFELICGERRVRAAALAGLESVPAVVKEVASNRLLELAIIENVQREDLNPIEEALAYSKLMENTRGTQEEVAHKVGKDRSTVANTMRLLRLPKEVQDLVASNLISAGHARALVSLISPEHQRVLAQRIVKESMSVRQTEEAAQGLLDGKKRAKRVRQLNPHVQDLERKLEMKLGTRVRVFHNRKNQGRIEIRYYSLDELDRVLENIGIDKS